MDVRVLRIDETEYWTELPAGVPQVFGVYLYAADQVTHCCEITPSYALWDVGWDVPMMLGDESAEWLDEHRASPDVQYMHVRLVERMVSEPFGDYETMDDAVEDYCANPVFC